MPFAIFYLQSVSHLLEVGRTRVVSSENFCGETKYV